MTTARQYEPETMKKAEFVAKIFSEFPKEKTDRVLEMENIYLDGINTGLSLSGANLNTQKE